MLLRLPPPGVQRVSVRPPPPQASGAQSEQALQGRLEEVCEELRSAQSSCGSLQARLEKAEQDNTSVSGEEPGGLRQYLGGDGTRE